MNKHRKYKNNKKNSYEHYFNKKYTFYNYDEYKFPDTVFEFRRWEIPHLQNLKKELNGVKSLLNNYDLKLWSKHTAYRDPSSSIIKKISETIKPELLTQAWCKFYEILKNFPVVSNETTQNKKLKTLHLCEAPGAFVCALNHYLVTEHSNIQFSWMATTLNPNYEGNQLSQMIPDDRLIRYTLDNWNFGSDFTGDITKFHNHLAIIKSEFCQSKVDIVTADGSIDCMKDPGEQEKFVEYLHFCETVTALSVLKPGGAFVLKIFTIFEDSTINLLYLLNCVFEKVTIFKPCTSKSGNSEVYVVNLNYKGFDSLTNIWYKIISVYENGRDYFLSKAVFNITDLPQQFYEEINICVTFFMNHQIKTILDNIYHFENQVSDNIQSKKWAVTKLFFQYHPINVILEEKKLVPSTTIGKNWRTHSENIDRKMHSYCREDILKNLSFDNILDITFGKKIETVFNSIFISKDYLSMCKSNICMNVNNFCLYKSVFTFLSAENILIDGSDYGSNVYHKFQYLFFMKIVKSLSSRNVIIFNVPLITHFLVGLLCILINGYKKIFFWNGFIILYESDPAALVKVKDILNEIKSIYGKINEQKLESHNNDFEKDIIHLFSPKIFDERFNNLTNLVWNYNSYIFSQNDVISVLNSNGKTMM